MQIRPATLADAPAILEIYNREVLGSTVTMDLIPRDLEQQRSYIEARSGGLAVLVAEETTVDGKQVIGWGGLSFYRERPAYRTSVENSIYVHHEHHRKGVGDQIMSALLEAAKLHGFHAVFARIAGPQEASYALHSKHGFTLVGIEKEVGRKFGQWHDVAVMQCLL